MFAFRENRSRGAHGPVEIGLHENMSFLAHWHTEIEIIQVLQGEMQVGINREVRTLGPGDMAVAASRDIHFYETKEFSLAVMSIFRPEILDCPGGWPVDGGFVTPFFCGSSDDITETAADVRHEVERILHEALRECEERREAYSLFIQGCMLELCALLLRHLPRSRPDTSEERRRLRQLERMHVALDYLESHFMYDLTPRDAASHVSLSVFHFSRLFQEAIGMSFKRYLGNLRVGKALVMLKDTDLPVTRIASECGFDSIRTFNRVFQAVKGCTPSSLR